ncbi:hypothetical protein QBC34DRAFT_417109 [Podospora aff. communis PSN243]|uniref:Uncharacterized protein n=1 Tax=Podospora aff. communis PSN243 TaxID=3040156 RepID=A0AAV9G5S4_9PEZI|nr:hypothetical protein QBC34DRAFT_417109 [Podospora aff. communis PSN243]
MASKLHIHKPYVLKALSQPLDRPDGPGRHTVGEVLGQKQGSKRRKRSELAVAIDGDAIHLYDIVSSQAVTSYLVSPQSFFTSAPYSLRWRQAATNTATRYTYASTRDSLSKKKEIKLFRDAQDESGTSKATTLSHAHRCDQPIIFLTATSPKGATQSLETGLPNHDVIAVAADGTILALHGETLDSKWQSAPTLFTQELSTSAGAKNFRVDFVQSALAADIVDGLFGGSNELFGVFQEKVHRDGFNPDILIAITSVKERDIRRRHLHILALPEDKPSRQSNGQNIISVFVAPLPTQIEPTKIQLDVKSGTLQELSNGALFTYSFKAGIPQLDNQLPVSGMASFLRLSRTSVLAATEASLSVYNPVFRSLQTSTPMNIDDTKAPETNTRCDLIVYLPSREVAVGLLGSSLIAIQIEAPAIRSNKRRADGLLVDAIRRGMSRQDTRKKGSRQEHAESVILAEQHPALFSEESEEEWREKSAKADELLQNNDLQGFEELLAGVFKVQVDEQQTEASGDETATPAALPKWTWLGPEAEYAHVDRRWVVYAIQKVFTWNETPDGEAIRHLSCRMPDSNVLGYLVAAGHLSVSNMKSAYKEQAQRLDEIDRIIGEELPAVLVEADPMMELLLGYLSGTQLGATELTCSVKLLLRSLGQLEPPSKRKGLPQDAPEQDEAENDAIAMELDRLEEDLQLAESYLAADSGSRAGALSIAFSKLAMCPAAATIQSLRRLFKPEETLCLMNILRAELIRDGWTTRYLDQKSDDEEEESEAAPNESIQLIAELMCRCLDSVGLGGWMAFDALLANGGDKDQDSLDFFAQFQAEVSVALEGILEAVRLQGTLSETINYAQRCIDAAKGSKLSKGSRYKGQMLPFGLKSDMRISTDRVRSGGEIVQRSRRQMGYFHSKKKKAYSVNRITEEILMGRHVARVVKEEGL